MPIFVNEVQAEVLPREATENDAVAVTPTKPATQDLIRKMALARERAERLQAD